VGYPAKALAKKFNPKNRGDFFMIKKMLSLLIVAIMLVTLVIPIQARSVYEDFVGVTSLVQVDGYVFEITEHMDEYYRAFRVFERHFVPFGEPSISEAKALLAALGMNEHMIALISDEDLTDIAHSPRIYSSVAFMQEDALGNVRYVCGIYAIERSSQINAIMLEQAEMSANYGIMPLNTAHHGHIQVTHIVSLPATVWGQETLLFTTGATWLSMPFFRNYGSIGSVAQNVALTSFNNASFSYSQNTITGGTIHTQHRTGTATSHPQGNGALDGAAARFRLPQDSHMNQSGVHISITNRDFSVAISHRAHSRNPDRTIGFNSRGSYTHRTVGVTSSPSISISTSGFSIGIGFGMNYNVYNSPKLHIVGDIARPIYATIED
jgi:hypothetical protein